MNSTQILGKYLDYFDAIPLKSPNFHSKQSYTPCFRIHLLIKKKISFLFSKNFFLNSENKKEGIFTLKNCAKNLSFMGIRLYCRCHKNAHRGAKHQRTSSLVEAKHYHIFQFQIFQLIFQGFISFLFPYIIYI